MPIRLALDENPPMSSTRSGSRLISPASYCTGSGTTMHPATPTGTGSCYPAIKNIYCIGSYVAGKELLFYGFISLLACLPNTVATHWGS